MVLAMWRLRKLREENEQKLKAVEEAAKEATKEAVNKAAKESLEKGREQGREEGREAERRRWQAWAQRGEEARAAGLPFDEPPPSERE